MRFRPTTLRTRLLLGTSAATAGVLLAAGLMIYVFVRASLLAEFDLALRSSVDALAALTEQDAEGVKMEPSVGSIADFTRKERPDYFGAWMMGGRAIATSASLAGGTLPHPTPARDASETRAVVLPDGLPGRQTTVSFVPVFEHPDGKTTPGTMLVTLSVARHTYDLDQKLAHLAYLLAGVGAAATLGAAGVMLLVVRAGLRPLAGLAREISLIGKENLGARVALADTPAELTTVVARLNALLDRLQATVLRERQFTADVAHELRTPLAGLETILDVCATRRRGAEEYERTVAKCQRIVRGMHAMVDTLMTLARADAAQIAVKLSSVPLAGLVRESWASYEESAGEKALRVTVEIEAGLAIRTDAERARMVINNLLDNAVSYTNTGGWIRIEGRAADCGRRVELCVSNSGSMLNDEQARRAFDRFWRGDGARRNTGVHCGLGLSLCRELMGLLSGEITATSEVGAAFLVRVVFPAAASTRSNTLEEEDRVAASGSPVKGALP